MTVLNYTATMLQRDYIQRLIREFMAALQRLLEKKEAKVRQEDVRRMFAQYFGDYAFTTPLRSTT